MPRSSNSKPYDVLLRLLMLGDSGVGKTCILCRYVDGNFLPNYGATIGIDFKVKDLALEDRRVRCQIWDTAGQERFETITKQYYRRAQGILIVYDISNEKTFNNLCKWTSFARQYARSNAEITILGNKTDLDEWRAVSREQGHKFSEQNSFGFFETSAYADSGYLDEVFQELMSRIMVNQCSELLRQQSLLLDSSSCQSSEYESEEESDGFHVRGNQTQGKCCKSS